MSRPRSSALEAERAALSALGREPAASDPGCAALRDARCGPAVAVVDPLTREFAFWLVPFIREDRACGRAVVDGSGRVQSIGSFGGGPRDEAAWPPAAFFHAAPHALLEDVRRAHPAAMEIAPVLSFDRTPAKWGWLVATPPPKPVRIFIGPRAWYVARSQINGDREG